MQKNYYQLLGIKESASPLEIKDAYRKLSKKIHPDLNQGETFFEEYFKEVKEAYETLSDQEKKRNYDTRRFRPAITNNAPPIPSNLVNLEYQVSRLELKLRDQNEQMATLQAEKKSLHQELEHFVKALFEVKNERSNLQSKVKELEQQTASLSKRPATVVEKAPDRSRELELQRSLQALEHELQNAQKQIATNAQELARENQVKIKLEKRLQELVLEAAQAQAREKQFTALTQEAAKQKARMQELEKQTQQVQAELQGKSRELELVLQHRKTLQLHLQELEDRKPEPTAVPAAKGEKNEKARYQQNQILEITTQKQALQNQVHDLELAAEQLKQVLQDKTKNLQQEKALKQELQAKLQNLSEQVAQQQEQLHRKTQELEGELKAKQAHQIKIQELEQEALRLGALLKAKAEEHTHLSQKLQELQAKLKALAQEETKLHATIQKLEGQAAKDQTELQARTQALQTANAQKQALQKELEDQKKTTATSQQDLQRKTKELEQETAQKRTAQSKIQDLEKEKATQVQRVTELQKELLAVKSRYTHLAHLQPFLVERMDFFNSATPKVYRDSFERADIKYIFSRMKIAVLADKPGKLNVLVKYVKPNGQLYFNPKSSPTGYSFAATLSYSPDDEYLYLSGWGSDRDTTFVAGDHRVEIYDETGRQLTKAHFMVKDKILKLSKLKSIF
ncbi:DnaJ domain-containing protein [Rufibacter hautae]|uniref:DnaJ domain-containing protein n=1 Tax=Rufibacter hautae TaxID=2595005 RepID=A0A5B6TCZ4_9BACT|nr:DnaJ domain-containing protein [Rufibacter hautae]KAA3438036.1 DnaJ domain-containing protein [Rufibacter hautae]